MIVEHIPQKHWSAYITLVCALVFVMSAWTMVARHKETLQFATAKALKAEVEVQSARDALTSRMDSVAVRREHQIRDLREGQYKILHEMHRRR